MLQWLKKGWVCQKLSSVRSDKYSGSNEVLTTFFVGLLQRFERLLPRVMYGKPVDLSALPLPPGVSHQTRPAPTVAALPKDSATDDEGPVKAGFSYVKRDLVRLLGVLCAGEKVVQDRVRACGGIPVVMNLCVVDERNPCESLDFTCSSIFHRPCRGQHPHCCAFSDLFIWTSWFFSGIDTLYSFSRPSRTRDIHPTQPSGRKRGKPTCGRPDSPSAATAVVIYGQATPFLEGMRW